MSDQSANNKQIAKNTLFLYFRMIILIIVQLYTVPVVLKNLGVSDYGLYNVIGGVVTMFTFIGGSLTSGVQRYVAYAIGKDDSLLLKRTFQTTVTIFWIFAIISMCFIECFGIWFLNNKMQIPQDRICAANWVLQFSIMTFVVNLISIPYNSTIVAHEKMNIYAYVSLFECFSKLLLAFSLPLIFFDKLIYYGAIMFCISLCIRLYYHYYCRKHFLECRNLSLEWDKKLGVNLLKYSGWNVIGTFANLGKQQGLNIVVNLFFGTIINASHSIASQVNGVINQFINNIYMATRPRITKLYACGKTDDMWNLVLSSSKLAFFLLIILCVPAIIEIDYVLELWLKEVPEYTTNIVILLLCTTLIETQTNQLFAAFQAANKIKYCQIYSSSILLLCIPFAYIGVKYICHNPLLPYLVSVSLSVVFISALLLVARKELHLSVSLYMKKVILPNLLCFSILFLCVEIISRNLEQSFLRLLVTILSTVLIAPIVVYIFGLSRQERNIVCNIVKTRIFKK